MSEGAPQMPAGFDLSRFRDRLMVLGGETHIMGVTEDEADALVADAQARNVSVEKQSATETDVDRFKLDDKHRFTIYLGHTTEAYKAFFKE